MSTVLFLLPLAFWCWISYRMFVWVMKDVPKGAQVPRSSWAYPSKEDAAEARRASEERRAARNRQTAQPRSSTGRDPLVEPSPTLPGLPQGQTVQTYAGEGMTDMRIFMVQEARKRGRSAEPDAA